MFMHVMTRLYVRLFGFAGTVDRIVKVFDKAINELEEVATQAAADVNAKSRAIDQLKEQQAVLYTELDRVSRIQTKLKNLIN